MLERIRPSFLFLFAAYTVLAMAEPARADLTITGQTVSVGAGSTATVNFYVTSTNPSGDNLASFQVVFQISQSSGSSSFLQFTSNSPSNFTSNPNYVYYNNSFTGSGFYSSPTTTTTPNDTIVGGDFAADGTNTTITNSTTFLLASVQFQTPVGATVGDSWTISLVPSSAYNVDDNTYFQDPYGNDINYTSGSATVDLVSTPEPSSIVLAGIGGLLLAFSVWKKRKNASSVAPVLS